MTDFLLIHGSAHGAWCWTDLIPHLEAAGHSARAIDLPSHGDDKTPLQDVTLDLYADRIRDHLGTETVLVAHSMAGYPATLAAERSPNQIKKLIYLCAHIPIPGKSIVDMRRLADSQPLAGVMIPSTDGTYVTIDPAKATNSFYHDVAQDRATWAVSKLCPQATLPQATPYPNALQSRYDKHYIRCLQDRAVPPSFQRMRTADWPADQITDLDTSHSPFLSDPALLASTLIRVTS